MKLSVKKHLRILRVLSLPFEHDPLTSVTRFKATTDKVEVIIVIRLANEHFEARQQARDIRLVEGSATVFKVMRTSMSLHGTPYKPITLTAKQLANSKDHLWP